MEMKRCINGHFYDPNKYESCPYCQGNQAQAFVNDHVEDMDKTIIPGRVDTPYEETPSLDGKTQVIMQELKNVDKKGHEEMQPIDPVVGWLVCIEGQQKGKDFRMHSENNYIGRGEDMDICILGDETISREKHAIISFDPRTKKYYFSPGSGRNIVRLNDQAVFMTNEIKLHDVIELGQTKFIFVPLCNDEFTWE